MTFSFFSLPFRCDRVLALTVLSLILFGLLMVASASMVISDQRYAYPFYYFNHQLIYTVASFVLTLLIVQIPLKLWKTFSVYIFLIALVLLVAVLIPGLGKLLNGSRRWIYFFGVSIQPSEFFKLALTLYLARYLSRFQEEVRHELKGFVKPMLVVGISAFLLLLEPDFGAAAVITMMTICLLFIGGVKLPPFLITLLSIVCAAFLLAIFSPYRLQRLTAFLNPWHNEFGSGYQLTQALMAFGRGGIFGVGLGNSVQKLFYLPEAHTDFLFAVIAEECGLIGAVSVLILFCLLVGRIFWIGWQARNQANLFASYLCYGIALWLGFQVAINIGVNVGILPTKGLTLPFISSGGSSLIINSLAIGLALRIGFENKGLIYETLMTRSTYS